MWHDAQHRGTSPWITGPILFAVLMLGPLGLSVYLLVRWRSPAASGPGLTG